jgi:hypothetical protein
MNMTDNAGKLIVVPWDKSQQIGVNRESSQPRITVRSQGGTLLHKVLDLLLTPAS